MVIRKILFIFASAKLNKNDENTTLHHVNNYYRHCFYVN